MRKKQYSYGDEHIAYSWRSQMSRFPLSRIPIKTKGHMILTAVIFTSVCAEERFGLVF